MQRHGLFLFYFGMWSPNLILSYTCNIDEMTVKNTNNALKLHTRPCPTLMKFLSLSLRRPRENPMTAWPSTMSFFGIKDIFRTSELKSTLQPMGYLGSPRRACNSHGVNLQNVVESSRHDYLHWHDHEWSSMRSIGRVQIRIKHHTYGISKPDFVSFQCFFPSITAISISFYTVGRTTACLRDPMTSPPFLFCHPLTTCVYEMDAPFCIVRRMSTPQLRVAFRSCHFRVRQLSP